MYFYFGMMYQWILKTEINVSVFYWSESANKKANVMISHVDMRGRNSFASLKFLNSNNVSEIQ